MTKRDDKIARGEGQPLRAKQPAGQLVERPDASSLPREAMAQERGEQCEPLLPKDLTDKAVADFWSVEDEWELHDAALLLEGIEPRPDRGSTLRKLLAGYDDRSVQDSDGQDGAQFVRLARIVRRVRTADQNGSLAIKLDPLSKYDREGRVREQREFVEPWAFLLWARDKSYEIPSVLQALLVEVPSRAELEQEATQLRSELSAAQARSKSARSSDLEAGERATMNKLAAYFARKYAYDPAAARTDATGRLREELQRHNITLDDKTIRKLLKLGAEQSD